MESKTTQGKSSFKGVFLGFVLGSLAGALAMYLNMPGPKASAPQVVKEACEPAQEVVPQVAPPTKPAKDFNFYGVLEHAEVAPTRPDEDQPPVPPQVKSGPAPAPAPESLSAAPEAPARPKAESKPFYLQLASFKAEADADALKAQIVMTGLPVAVAASEVAELGMRYRVRVGPFTSQEALEQAKSQLQAGNVAVQQAIVVR